LKLKHYIGFAAPVEGGPSRRTTSWTSEFVPQSIPRSIDWRSGAKFAGLSGASTITARFSKLLDQPLSPDIDQVARALARKFRWHIQPSGATALNFLGLSTQVPARATYLSDGPDRVYQIGNTALVFEHTALKESGVDLKESGLIVQALKSLGQERITPEVIAKIRAWLPESTTLQSSGGYQDGDRLGLRRNPADHARGASWIGSPPAQPRTGGIYSASRPAGLA